MSITVESVQLLDDIEPGTVSDVTVTVVPGAGLSKAEADALYAPLGAGGAVDSVNGHTGVVVLAASDVGADASGAAAAAQAAATAAAATDATTKANAAQAGAESTAAGDVSTHAAAADPHTGYQKESERAAASGYASLDGSTKVPIAQLPTGATSSTVAVGNDSRLSDARTPTAHASTHASAGSDPVTLAESQVTNLTADLAAKAPLASPALTGTPTVPTAAGATNTTQAASTAFVHGEVATEATVRSTADALLAPLASPTFTGTPAAPTPTAADSTTKVATTAFVQGELTAKAPLASPTFTGDPKAPTPTAGDNDTSIATTAFVTAAVAAVPGSTAVTRIGGANGGSTNQNTIGTGLTDLTGLSSGCTTVGHKVRVSCNLFCTASAAGNPVDIWVYEGATQIGLLTQEITQNPNGFEFLGWLEFTPSAGSHTYKLASASGGGTFNVLNATKSAQMVIEDMGV